MSGWDEGRLPDDLQDVARRLRDEARALDVDGIRTRAMGATERSRTRAPARSRVLVALLSLGLMAGGTGGVIAAGGGTGNGNGDGNGAANSQYCPPSSPGAGKPKDPPPGNKCGQDDDGGGGRGAE